MKILRYQMFIGIITPKVENSQYENTSWTKEIDGREVTITIHQVQDYLKSVSAPVIEIPVSEIYHMCCHEGKTDIKTIDRSEKSDLSYPIIIAKGLNGEWSMILDGHHRLFKAHNHKIEKIKAIVLDLNQSPREYQSMFGG